MIWKFWRPSCHTALLRVMADVGVVGKHDRNEDAAFSFRGIDAVVNAVYPALIANGILVTPKVLDFHTETVQIGTGRSVHSRTTLVMEYTWRGPRGDVIVTSAPGDAIDLGDKATSKASSVAFRTALLQALTLPTGDRDPDAESYIRSQETPAQAPGRQAAVDAERRPFIGTVEEANAARSTLAAAMEGHGWTEEKLLAEYRRRTRGADLLRADSRAVRDFHDDLRSELGQLAVNQS